MIIKEWMLSGLICVLALVTIFYGPPVKPTRYQLKVYKISVISLVAVIFGLYILYLHLF